MIRFLAPWLAALALFSSAAGLRGAPSSAEIEVAHHAFELVNQYRRSQGMTLLTWLPAAAQVAQSHTWDMASGACDFGHDGFGDRVRLVKAAVPDLRGAGENVFETEVPDKIAESAVAHWLESPAHLHNIRGDFNFSGMGAVRSSSGTWYLTQFFLKTAPPPPQEPAPVAAPFQFP